jgi:hypothetical protein
MDPVVWPGPLAARPVSDVDVLAAVAQQGLTSHMIPTPSALSHLISSGLITLHTAVRQVWKDRPPFKVVLTISCCDGPPVMCGSSTRPTELRCLVREASAAVAAASAHAKLRVAAELEKRRAGGLG